MKQTISPDSPEYKDAFKNKEIKVKHVGTQIVLPDAPRRMTYSEAADVLKNIDKQQKVTVKVHEEVECFPLEGAYALSAVLQQRYGFTMNEPKKSFFGDIPPALVSLSISTKETAQVIWGQFRLPGMEDCLLDCGVTMKEGRRIFLISGNCRKGDQEEVREIARLVREYVRTRSIYRGKAFRVVTAKNDDGEYVMDLDSPPTFLETDGIAEKDLIFSEDVTSLIKHNIFTPIEYTDLCRSSGVPLKRGVLLYGVYGTGKTLTARVASRKCVDNGWTFIYLDRAQGLKDALLFARQYSPAVIFAEDIERVVEEARGVGVDDVLNNIDGIDSKGQEIMCIFTTNHVEKINVAMLRPGRLDAVIKVTPPDGEAAIRLVKLYARDLLDASTDLGSAAQELAGQIPASIREAVERAKLHAIARVGGTGAPVQLTGEDVRLAAISMRAHLELATPRPETPSVGDRLVEALSEVVGSKEIERLSRNTNTTLKNALRH